jgi:hypothetical protein
VAFYPSDWLAGVARMSRKHRSVYFDVCCYNWDQNRPCPEAHLAVMLGDMKDWRVIVDELVAIGKLERGADGSIGNARALVESAKAFDLWQRKSAGGRKHSPKQSKQESSKTDGIEPEPEPEPDSPKRERRASALPRCWVPQLTDRARETVAAWPEGMLDRELMQFMDHAKAKGLTYKDWDAAFRTWIANADKWNKERSNGKAPIKRRGIWDEEDRPSVAASH